MAGLACPPKLRSTKAGPSHPMSARPRAHLNLSYFVDAFTARRFSARCARPWDSGRSPANRRALAHRASAVLAPNPSVLRAEYRKALRTLPETDGAAAAVQLCQAPHLFVWV